MLNMSNTKLWAITILGLAIGWVVFQAAPALQPALIAIVVAYLLNPLVDVIEKELKVKKWQAIIILFTVMVVLLIFLSNLILPKIVLQATEFIKEFQSISGNFNQMIKDISLFLEERGVSQSVLNEFKQYIEQFFNWLANFLLSIISSTLGYILKAVDLVLILIMTIYFLSSGKEMVRYIVDHSPKSLRKTALNLIEGTDRVVWNYVKTQVIIAIIIGVVSTLAFMLIGVRFSFLLGVIAGTLNFIPYFGSIFAGAIATTIALLTGGFKQAIITLIVVLIIQQVEGNLITPRLQGKSTGLHPVIIIIVILIGSHFWGTVGMFIAVPLFGLARLFVTEVIKLINQIE